MTSTVDIANRALTKLGDDRITSFADNTPAARAISSAYDIVRDAVLREHVWGFATRRAALAASSTAPVYGYDRAFQLPSNFIRLVEIQGQTSGYGDWRVAGRRIEISASAPLYITYIARIVDPNEYDGMFIEALAARLAAELAAELSDNNGLGMRMETVYRDLLSRAMMVDAKESSPRQTVNGTWLDARNADFA